MGRSTLLILLALFPLQLFSQIQEMLVSGVYRGANLYVQNPTGGSGIGFCIDSVWINDSLFKYEQSSAFELPFDKIGLKDGDSVTIRINHWQDCLPKLITAGTDFRWTEIQESSIVNGREIRWTTRGDVLMRCYSVQQYRWNKWIPVKDTCGASKSFSVQLKRSDKHSGMNKYRVVMRDLLAGTRDYSNPLHYQSGMDSVSYELNGNTVVFSDSTRFEVFDTHGNVVDRGVSDKINLREYNGYDGYFLNFDNQMVVLESEIRD